MLNINSSFFLKKINRYHLAKIYLKGEGIEIGALHNPLPVPSHVRVKYVDRMSKNALKKHYEELSQLSLVEIDIIDDGEKLETISNESQDFVIANHFIEHAQNPILTIQNMLRVLKKGGVLYIALPDKRYTFDQDRPITPLEHLITDYERGPEYSRYAHFEEWTRFVAKPTPEKFQQSLQNYLSTDYSIHFHVWTQTEMLELFLFMKRHFHLDFDIEVCVKHDVEFILVLRKQA